MAESRPSAARVIFSVGVLMWLIPIVLILGALFVAVMVVAGWYGLVTGAVLFAVVAAVVVRTRQPRAVRHPSRNHRRQ